MGDTVEGNLQLRSSIPHSTLLRVCEDSVTDSRSSSISPSTLLLRSLALLRHRRENGHAELQNDESSSKKARIA